MDSEISFEEIHCVDVLGRYEHLAARNHIASAKEHFDGHKFIGIGAKCGEKPIGLLLGWAEASRATVGSVFVSKEYRRQGIATRLVELVEQNAVKKDARKLTISLRSGSNSEPIQGVLRKNRWSQPLPQRFLDSDCGPTMTLSEAPWLKRNLNDDRLEVFPWHEISPAEIKTLERAEASPDCWFPDQLSPLIDHSNLHRPTSLGLRFKDEVIGWIITHQIKEGPIVFITMFARPTPEYPLAGLKMMQVLAHRLIKISKTQAPVQLHLSIVEGNKFFQFMEKRVFDYLSTEVRRMDVISKTLESQPLQGTGR